MTSPVSGLSAVSFVPTSPEEALSLISFVSDAESEFRSHVARARLDSVLTVIGARYDQLKALTVRLLDRIVQSNTPVTVDSLSRVERSETALRKLFSDDGPNLGATLSESNTLYSDLNRSGVVFDAPILTPVLLESINRDGKVLSRSFSWLDDLKVAMLSKLQSGAVSEFPGSDVRETVVKDSQGRIIEISRFTVFSDYANRRPTPAALSSAVGLISTLVDKTSEILQAELIRAANAISDVEKLNLQSLQFQLESNQSISLERSSRVELREDSLRRERFIRKERELRAIQSDSSTGISNISSVESKATINADPNSILPSSESKITSEVDRASNLKSDRGPL